MSLLAYGWQVPNNFGQVPRHTLDPRL